MKSSNPHSGIYEAETARTLDLNGGNPACNQGGIAVVEPVPYTLKIRGGVEVDSAGKAAGKGALIQKNMSATLAAAQDQYLFQPVTEQHLFENHSQDSRYRGPLDVCPMLPAQLGTGGNNQPFVVEHTVFRKGTRPHSTDEAQKWEEAETANTLNTFDQGEARANELVVCIEGNGARPSHLGDGYSESDTMYTLNTIERHAVAYTETVSLLGDKVAGTLMARDYKGIGRHDTLGSAVCIPTTTHFIVRRLTPTECARLQGFPDTWGHPDVKTELTDEEYAFWLNTRNAHAEINGKATKEYTREQMLTWYNKLHTDSSEYKLWGNGIALPCALYVMQGIAEVSNEN